MSKIAKFSQPRIICRVDLRHRFASTLRVTAFNMLRLGGETDIHVTLIARQFDINFRDYIVRVLYKDAY